MPKASLPGAGWPPNGADFSFRLGLSHARASG